MEREESIILHVVPRYQNTKVKEMEMFGWILRNMQEFHAPYEGTIEEDVPITGSIGSYYPRSYTVRTTKAMHYVKLHFGRNLNLPNINEIKNIESAYFSLPIPSLHPGFASLALLVIGGLAFISFVSASWLFVVTILFGGIIFYGLHSTEKKYDEIRRKSLKRREELKQQLMELMTTKS